LLITLALATGVFGASARWNCLGFEHRFMLDTSNYGIYPARMMMFADAVWVIPSIPAAAAVPDNMMAGLLVSQGQQAWAIHYNLPGTIAFNRLRTGLNQAGGNLGLLADRLRPMPDAFYARKLGDMTVAGRLVLGLASSEPVADKSASGMAIDVAGGIIKPLSVGDLDVGLRIASASFKDDAANIESTGGMGLAMDARLLMKGSGGVTLIPLFGFEYGTDPTVDGAAEVSRLGVDLGIGWNRMDASKRMLVYGATLAYDAVTTSPPAGSDVSVNTLELAYLAGYEKPLNKWLVGRAGARGVITNNSGDNPAVNGTRANFDYNFGIRTIYQRVLLDFQFDKALLHRGPYVLSGAAANWSPNVCITYLLEPAE